MQKIIIENARGRVEFFNTRPFVLEKIDGINNPRSSNITTKAPNQDGVSLYGSSFDARTILIKIGIVGETEQEMYYLRRKLYNILNGKLNSTLTYINSDKTYTIDCKIENITEDVKRNNMQKLTIQLYCANPFWKDLNEFKEEIALWVGEFTFPLIIPKTGIRMGKRVSNLIVNVNNIGDVSCGIKIEFMSLGTVKNPSLFNIHTREFIKLNIIMLAGDRIVIQTSFANKRIELIRNNVTTNILHYIDWDSTFLQLETGDNLFRYDAEEGIDNLECSVYYRPKYLGV